MRTRARRAFAPEAGELVLDVTREGPERFRMNVVLRVGGGPGEQLVPVRFIGSPGHGIVCVELSDVDGGLKPERWRIRLVGSSGQRSPAQRMLLDGERIAIPATELDRFAAELCPGLRHIAPVVSCDGSFVPPTVSAPSLALRAEHGPETLVTLGWEWEYKVGDSGPRVLSTTRAMPPGFATTPPSGSDSRRPRSTSPDSRGCRCSMRAAARRAGRRRSWGLESLRFVTEVLPLVTERPELRVGVSGSRRTTATSATRSIGVSTDEIAGERDWFDLGVTISVEGRELPFAEVFASLPGGESRMLLDDGAHFSLAIPASSRLRRLIEEARALIDSPRRRCGSAATRRTCGRSWRSASSRADRAVAADGRRRC